MRKFMHDDNFVLSNNFFGYFYLYMTILKKIDFQPPNGRLATFVSAWGMICFFCVCVSGSGWKKCLSNRPILTKFHIRI